MDYLKKLNEAKFNHVQFAEYTYFLLDIQSMDSTSTPLVQVADWVCGALARYYEGKQLGKELYDELKRNIIQKKELFKDYWTKKWEG